MEQANLINYDEMLTISLVQEIVRLIESKDEG
jgi:hypothetical protein